MEFNFFELAFLISSIIIIHFKNSGIKSSTRDDNFRMNYKIYKNGLSTYALSATKLPKISFDYILALEENSDCCVNDIIKDIFSKFVNYIDPINLEYCLNNIGSIKISQSHSLNQHFVNLTSPQIISGSYNHHLNSIEVYFKEKSVLSHEFLHMASNCPFRYNLCGFSVSGYDSFTNRYDYFGYGLNEGYTEVLNSRIFLDGKKSGSYVQCFKIAKLLECFFDDYRDMEYAYFHNDISAVYEAFCKYGTRDEFFTIMNELDNYAFCFNSLDYLNSIRVQLKLYEIIKRSNDSVKIENFEAILNNNIKKLEKKELGILSFDNISFKNKM